MTDKRDTQAAIAAAKQRMAALLRKRQIGLALECYGRLTGRTPVDTGRARNNWFIGIGAPDTTTTEATSKARNPGAGRARSTLSRYQFGDAIYITNALPYIRVLEFGEYPDPPERGSWVKGEGWVKKSQGGFSKQAPQGIVGITVLEMLSIARMVGGSMSQEGPAE